MYLHSWRLGLGGYAQFRRQELKPQRQSQCSLSPMLG